MTDSYLWVNARFNIVNCRTGPGEPFQLVPSKDGQTANIVPTDLYEAVVRHFATTRMIGRAVPCPGCDWDGCVDCNPELVDGWSGDEHEPVHPEWLQPTDDDAIHEAIGRLEAWISERG